MASLIYATGSTDVLVSIVFLGFLGLAAFILYSVADAARLSWISGSESKATWRRWYSIAAIIILGTALHEGSERLFPIRTESFHIPSTSNMPTLRSNDRLIADTMWRAIRDVQRGDVMVFYPVSQPEQAYIHRVIGLPGDTVQMRSGALYLNGVMVPRKLAGEIEVKYRGKTVTAKIMRESLANERSYLTLDLESNSSGDNTGIFEGPDGFVFMLGDNRDNSLDSRFSMRGMIPVESLYSRALYVFWADNLDRIGEIE